MSLVRQISDVTGTVVDAVGGVDNAKVEICPIDSTGPCAPGGDLDTRSAGATGIFTLVSQPLPVGTYKVWAEKGGNKNSAVLTVNVDGTQSLVPTAIDIS